MPRSHCAWMFSWLSVAILVTGCGGSSTDYTAAPAARSASRTAEESRDFPNRYEPNVKSPAAASAATTPSDQGVGPGQAGDRYAYLQENSFVTVRDQPLSTFSIDIDTASYSKSRMYLMQHGQLPPVDAVRIEEFINYFDYDYEPPTNGDPFAIHTEVADCPWNAEHRLARIALKGREIRQDRPPCNLVFLLDVSGSMESPQRIGLVKKSLRLLIPQLNAQDRASIVVYASQEGLVLPATPGDRHPEILDALERLEAGGATNGGAGIRLAYSVAKENLIPDGVNRVILCTDGDFNVGTTSTGDLVRLAEAEARAGVFLTVLGFGMGNHNDAMLEQISDKANGAYAFIDNETEARKIFVDQIDGTLVTIAKDVKIQVEFNPAQIAAYRLIGYENRLLQAHEFNDDRKDAGDVGAGHTVTALYEITPAHDGHSQERPLVDPLKYQKPQEPIAPAVASDELMTVKVRYKDPTSKHSKLLTHPIVSNGQDFAKASMDFRFAASVAAFGMILRRSELAGDVNLDAIYEMASAATGRDRLGYRSEFLKMVAAAQKVAGLNQTSSINSASRPVIHIGAPRVQPATLVRRQCVLPFTFSDLNYFSIGLILLVAFQIWALVIISLIVVGSKLASQKHHCPKGFPVASKGIPFSGSGP